MPFKSSVCLVMQNSWLQVWSFVQKPTKHSKHKQDCTCTQNHHTYLYNVHACKSYTTCMATMNMATACFKKLPLPSVCTHFPI